MHSNIIIELQNSLLIMNYKFLLHTLFDEIMCLLHGAWFLEEHNINLFNMLSIGTVLFEPQK